MRQAPTPSFGVGAGAEEKRNEFLVFIPSLAFSAPTH